MTRLLIYAIHLLPINGTRILPEKHFDQDSLNERERRVTFDVSFIFPNFISKISRLVIEDVLVNKTQFYRHKFARCSIG